MDRVINQSTAQKTVFAGIHFISILISFWILFSSGQDIITGIFGQTEIPNSDISRIVLFSCSFIYFLRHVITLFFFIKRQVPWSEVFGVGFFISIVQVLFAVITIYNKEGLTYFDLGLVILYLFGSYLNTNSEFQRMLWKKDQNNKGKLYTLGLFKYSMHINYLGDTILFTAFALLTGSLWALLVPIFITLGFIFYHIPELDKYLQNKYKEQFMDYEKRTKKFIPWVY